MSRVFLRPRFDNSQSSKEVKGDWTKVGLDTGDAYKFLQQARDELLQMESLKSELKKTKGELKTQQYRNSLLFEELQAEMKKHTDYERLKSELNQLKPKYNQLVAYHAARDERNELSNRIKELSEQKARPRRTIRIGSKND